MRISLLTKIALSYLLFLLAFVVPSFLYHHSLRKKADSSVEQIEKLLTSQLTAASSTLRLNIDENPTQAMNEIYQLQKNWPPPAQFSLFALPGKSEEWLNKFPSNIDKSASEIESALKSKRTESSRRIGPNGEYYLYVAQLVNGSNNQPYGIVRLSYPLGELFHATQSGFNFQYVLWGIAASVGFMLLLGFWFYTLKPMRQISKAGNAYVEREYNMPLPSLTFKDEVADITEFLVKLAQKLQRETVQVSAEQAIRAELVRAIPLPLAILSSQFEAREINAQFREVIEVEPVRESMRLQTLYNLPEMKEAQQQALQTRTPQLVKLQLPWQHYSVSILLAALPELEGQYSWALLIPSSSSLVKQNQREIAYLLRRGQTLLEELAQKQTPEKEPLFVANLVELRILLDLVDSLQREEEFHATLISTEWGLVVEFVLAEIQPLLTVTKVAFAFEKPAAPILIIDRNKEVERVLRGFLARAIAATRFTKGNEELETQLSVTLTLTDTTVRILASGLRTHIVTEDLDRLLSPLGGSVGPMLQEQMAESSEAAKNEHEAWIYLRRA